MIWQRDDQYPGLVFTRGSSAVVIGGTGRIGASLYDFIRMLDALTYCRIPFFSRAHEMAALVRGANRAFEAVGTGADERAAALNARAVRDIEAGEEFTSESIRVIRPGLGLPPKKLPKLLGRRVSRRIGRGTCPGIWSRNRA